MNELNEAIKNASNNPFSQSLMDYDLAAPAAQLYPVLAPARSILLPPPPHPKNMSKKEYKVAYRQYNALVAYHYGPSHDKNGKKIRKRMPAFPKYASSLGANWRHLTGVKTNQHPTTPKRNPETEAQWKPMR